MFGLKPSLNVRPKINRHRKFQKKSVTGLFGLITDFVFLFWCFGCSDHYQPFCPAVDNDYYEDANKAKKVVNGHAVLHK